MMFIFQYRIFVHMKKKTLLKKGPKNAPVVFLSHLFAPGIQTSLHNSKVNQYLPGRHTINSHNHVHTTAGVLS